MASPLKAILLALVLATITVRVESQLTIDSEPVEEDDMTPQQLADKAERKEAAKVIMSADLHDYGFWPTVFMKIGQHTKNFFVQIGQSISSFLNKIMDSLMSMFGGSSTNSFRGTEHTIEVAKREDSMADQAVDQAMQAAVTEDLPPSESKPEPITITNSYDDANNREVTVDDVVQAAEEAKEAWDDYVNDMVTPSATYGLVQVKDRFESPHRQRHRRKGALTTQALIQDSI